MAACESQRPEIHTPYGAMEFEVAELSRASVTTSQNITASPFAVYGDMTFNANQSRTVIFNGSEVSFSGTANKWQYSDTQYWFPNHEHSFVAVHPYPDAANAPCLSDIRYNSDSQLKFKYTYPTGNYKDAADVLAATHRRSYSGSGNVPPVRFSFAHILSNINIQVIYYNPSFDAVPLTVRGISFRNIPVEACYSVAPAKLSGNAMTYDYVTDPESYEGWTITKRGDLDIKFPDTGDDSRLIPPDYAPHQLFSGSDALLLLPNPETPTEMTISYTNYTGSERHDNTDTLSIPISWRPGYNYTLSFSVIHDKLLFSYEVEEWKFEEPTTTTVPRK